MNRQEFSAFKQPPIAVEIPEWGKSIHLRVLSGLEKWSWLKYIGLHEDDGLLNMYALLARSICDEQGNRLFGDEDADINEIARQDSKVLDRLNRQALRINGEGEEGRDEAKKN